jgi:hypothetical protein
MIMTKLEVPSVDVMNDETFIKHFNLRHASDITSGPLSYNPHVTYIPSFRAFHDRCHAISTPNQYDHSHEETY